MLYVKMMYSKKAQSLSLNTVIIFIIVLVVLVVVLIIFTKTGNAVFAAIKDRVDVSTSLAKSLPKSP